VKLNEKSSSSANKIFVNGVIYSIDSNSSVYESMAIKDGSIIALGSNEDVSNYSNDKTEVIDLKFKTMLPGFIDAHCHIPERMMIKKHELSLFDVSSPWQYLKLIQSYVDSHSEEKIIYGAGWKCSAFEGDENGSNRYTEIFKGPNKKWLEKIKTDKPIVLKDYNGHALWLNNKAFDYFKITKHTEVPGGKIELDEQGELWGILKENAMKLVNIDNSQHYKDKEYLSRFIKYQNMLHSYGITTISLIDEEKSEMPLELYRRLEITNQLKLKIIYGVTIMPYEVCKKTICEQIHQLKRNRIIYKTELFDLSIAKFFADGIIEMETAYLFKPYRSIGEKFAKTNGIFKWDMLEFNEGIKMANRLDFNVFVHAVGDLACKLAIDGIEYSVKNNIKGRYRNSLIHMDLITKYYIRRMRNSSINAITQPFWFYKDVNSSRNDVLAIGEERAHRQYPLKSLIDEGIVTAGSSNHDASEAPNPLNAIECSVIRNLYDFIPSGYPEKVDMNDARYRLNPSERILIKEAVKIFTINAAYVLGKEKEIGSLEIGKKADFTILDKDIFNAEPLDIHDIRVVRTYFNGELVYLNE